MVCLSIESHCLGAIVEISVYIGSWVVINNLGSLIQYYGLLAFMSIFPKLIVLFYTMDAHLLFCLLTQGLMRYLHSLSLFFLTTSLRNFVCEDMSLCLSVSLCAGRGHRKVGGGHRVWGGRSVTYSENRRDTGWLGTRSQGTVV